MTGDENQRQLVVRIVKEATPDENLALQNWALSLLAIKDKQISAAAKMREAIAATARSQAILPALKIIARQIKRHGWDDRSQSARVGISAAAIGLTLFGGANAGIAALGGAIGVPLWVVLGAGGMFVSHLYDELRAEFRRQNDTVTYTVLDAKKENNSSDDNSDGDA